MAISRMITRSSRKQEGKISLRNSFEIGKRISATYLSSRRSTLPAKIVSRVLNAMAVRRLQETDGTQFSLMFDKTIVSTTAVVPEMVNAVLAGIPLRGVYKSQIDVVNVTLLENDLKEVTAYINMPLFVEDLTAILNFIQTNGLVGVPLEWNRPFQQPSVNLRYDIDIDITMPYETQVLTELVPVSEVESGERTIAKVSKSFDSAVAAVVQTEIEYEQAALQPPMASVDPKYSRAAFDNLSYHFPGSDESITTIGKSVGYMYPIFIKTDKLDEPDWLDVVQGTRSAILFDTSNDENLTTFDAIRMSIELFAIQVQHEREAGKPVSGTVDTRSGLSNTHAGLGSPLNPRTTPIRNEPDNSYTLPQTGTSAVSTVQGVSRPNLSPKQGQGQRQRVGKTQAISERNYQISNHKLGRKVRGALNGNML